jgi:tetratricopeptide (TPR) repeat protein
VIQRALAIDAYDPDANYLYGVVNRRLGRLYDAVDGFGVAARSAKYRAAASLELAEAFFLIKRYDDAMRYARRSLDYDRTNIRSHALLVLISRLRRDRRGPPTRRFH